MKEFLKKFTLITILIVFHLQLKALAQPGWIHQNSTTSLELYSIRFLNETTGWAVGDSGLILKTTNGGESWVSSRFERTPWRDLYFFNAGTGVIVGGNWGFPPFVPPENVIIKTTNGGINWNVIAHSYGNVFSNLQFVNDSVGFIGSDGVYKTTNQGDSWEYHDNICNQNCFFINENTGYASCGSSTAVYKSTNGGINWITLPHNMGNVGDGIFFCDLNTGYFTGYSKIQKTTDAGKSFQNMWYTDYYFRSVKGIFFTDPEKGVILAHKNFPNSNIIQLTTNGGVNWSNTYFPSRLNSVFFINKLTGWIAGKQGTILKTTTGGITNIQTNVNSSADRFFLYQNYPNPFNSATRIKFEIHSTGFVSLKVFSASGKETATLVSEYLNPGTYNVDFQGDDLASGIYFYKIQAENYSEIRSMTLLK